MKNIEKDTMMNSINGEVVQTLVNALKLFAIEKNDIIDIDYEVEGVRFVNIERIKSGSLKYFAARTDSNDIRFLELIDPLKFTLRLVDVNVKISHDDEYIMLSNDILFVDAGEDNRKLINLSTNEILIDFTYTPLIDVIGKSDTEMYISAINTETDQIEVIHLIDGVVFKVLNVPYAEKIETMIDDSVDCKLFVMQLEEGSLLDLFKYNEETRLFEKIMSLSYFINSGRTKYMLIYKDDILYSYNKCTCEETKINLFNGEPYGLVKLSSTYNFRKSDYLVKAICNNIKYLIDFKGNIVVEDYNKFIHLGKANKLDQLISCPKEHYLNSVGYTKTDGTAWCYDLITKEKRKLHLTSVGLKFKTSFKK